MKATTAQNNFLKYRLYNIKVKSIENKTHV